MEGLKLCDFNVHKEDNEKAIKVRVVTTTAGSVRCCRRSSLFFSSLCLLFPPASLPKNVTYSALPSSPSSTTTSNVNSSGNDGAEPGQIITWAKTLLQRCMSCPPSSTTQDSLLPICLCTRHTSHSHRSRTRIGSVGDQCGALGAGVDVTQQFRPV
jgi:hypothetical protein